MKKDNGKGLAYYQNLKLKYLNNAKEAASLGDRVLSEYNLQFAEHYGRVISCKLNQQNPAQPQSKQSPGIVESMQELEDSTSCTSSDEPVRRTKKRKIKSSEATGETIF
ncbi:MAG: DUF4167 domain-containing protein [Holosporales bacterium]|jgi:hypothetical protein|nr:DUF4167 domain-containing protein [Holosporales bacterium]